MFIKRITLNYTAFIFLIGMSGFSNAGCGGIDCAGVTIDRIYMRPGASSLAISTSGDESKLDCSASSGRYISLPLNESASNEAYALILAAHQAQSIFWVKTTGSGTDCKVVYLVSDK